jgi:hypothetical protein
VSAGARPSDVAGTCTAGRVSAAVPACIHTHTYTHKDVPRTTGRSWGDDDGALAPAAATTVGTVCATPRGAPAVVVGLGWRGMSGCGSMGRAARPSCPWARARLPASDGDWRGLLRGLALAACCRGDRALAGRAAFGVSGVARIRGTSPPDHPNSPRPRPPPRQAHRYVHERTGISLSTGADRQHAPPATM